ncbi:hypothetical protein PSACC_03149 [Paramicrosporidium saccamoebae]|uniref:PPM-type phosphatase domain-containing protein n=1 Tax=Paramicrosporidium saccamoebae TaxID=1246581 RepID=A0A2H9TH48_9FUNG|nr:hypothetical protein PSACC_03149 [Paramicrosporidium saccamoebae]
MAANTLQSSALPAELSRAVGERIKISVKILIKNTSCHKDLHMTLLSKYESIVKSGLIKCDQGQVQVVEKLQALCNIISQTQPAESSVRLWHRFFQKHQEQLMGMYLYGGVGSGKTMLMDLFFSHCNVPLKRRTHYNSFMLNLKSEKDPVRTVANHLAAETKLLCLDEFQVVDVADAMLWRNLLRGLMDRGMYLLLTSNRPPKELYLNGIQRAAFVPCIELLEKRLDVVNLTGQQDYRRRRKGNSLFYAPINDETSEGINELLASLLGPRTIYTHGRPIHVAACRGDVAKFTFEELCSRPMSAADYLCIADAFPVIIITDVPKLTISHRDEARRFITMIDVFYDHKIKLILQSEVPIDELFQLEKQDVSAAESMRVLADELALSNHALVWLGYCCLIFTGACPGGPSIYSITLCCETMMVLCDESMTSVNASIKDAGHGGREWCASGGEVNTPASVEFFADAHCFFYDFGEVKDQGFFAVFDGHGGKSAAAWCGEHFPELLLKNLPGGIVPEVLDQTFAEADSFLNAAHGIFSGCTAIVALYRHEQRDGQDVTVLYTGNTGDSRAVLYREGKAIRLSYDHKGSDVIEQQRVKDAGGFILNDRVNGMLAITRALGDAEMKDYIAGRPYTTETVIDRTKDSILILACDGLWDVCSDQEACDHIKDVTDTQKAAEMLVEYAIKNDSYDNLSVLVIRFRC